ncbi:MAG: TolC family protein, partial [Phycisphaerae bacterium]|nr:TolC family protein [Phycisphaerae bacterium]
VLIGLQQAIATAVRNNLGVQGARLEQAVTQADIERAEAAFDAVLFANTGFNRIDSQDVIFAAPGEIVPTVFGNNSKSWTFSTGIQQPLVTGGAVTVSTNWEWQKWYPVQFYFPNSSWNDNVQLGFTQPLLQGFGSDVNMAQIRLARNADRKSMQALRERLLALVAQAEAAYWQLVLARQRLTIQIWLVDAGVDVRDVLAKRRQFDTTLAEYADSVAVVENRKSAVIRARRDVQQAADRLKVLMNDPSLPIGDETTIVPTDLMVEQPLSASLREAITTAIQQSPSVARALLDIDDASIREVVADNGRLPQLNLNAQAQWSGLDGSYGETWSEIGQGQFVDYIVGLSFSQAIGNRYGEATFRRARLERSQAVIGYRTAVQDSVLQVKDALRNVVTNYQLIGQTRAFRMAQAENLRALLVTEQTIASLTPEFLNLKFQRQDGLAGAQLQESTALVDYNSAIAELYRAMGTGLAMNRIELETEPDDRSR